MKTRIPGEWKGNIMVSMKTNINAGKIEKWYSEWWRKGAAIVNFSNCAEIYIEYNYIGELGYCYWL